MILLCLFALQQAEPVHAASGRVYTCTIHPSYSHPVTGEIEDAGGSSAQATGQGMAEGCIGDTGMLEETGNGQYYLTIRLSLMDYTSDHQFWVQNRGDTGWTAPAVGVTGTGTDSNGTTNDVTMEVPSPECVVRIQMYVEPMGRNVIFYLYPDNITEGNSSGMTPQMVTSDSSGAAGSLSSQDGASGISSAAGGAADGTSDTTGGSGGQYDAEGLSLSTAGEDDSAAGSGGTSESASSLGTLIIAITIAILIAGLILIAVGAATAYWFARNWHRISRSHDNDEYEYEE